MIWQAYSNITNKIAPVTKRISDEQYNLEDLSRVQVKSVKYSIVNSAIPITGVKFNLTWSKCLMG